MKWCNKSRRARRENWAVAMAPKQEHVKDAHKWCVEQKSEMRFYHHFTNTRWWFENEEDAFLFSLRWS